MKLTALILLIGFAQLQVYGQKEIIFFYKTGEVKEKAYAMNDSMAHIITYFKDGKVKAERYLKDNRPHGVWMSYSQSGTIVGIRQYNDGVPAGIWTIIPEGSQMKYFKHFRKGKVIRQQQIDAYGQVVASN